MNLWIPDRAGRDAVGELPEGVSLGLVPRDGELPETILEAEFLVPPAGDRRVLDLLARMPALRVIQTLSAGVDWLLPFVPPGVTVCDAGGTRDVAVADLLGRLRPGALLVNAARGPILDTAALLELLSAGRVRAALDVTDPEPLPAEHPLWDAPGLLLTPHFAGDTIAADRRAFALVGAQVRRFAGGGLLANIVEGGY